METNLTEEKLVALKYSFVKFEEKLYVEVVEDERVLHFDPKEGFSLKFF
jgi:hypothetical protein